MRSLVLILFIIALGGSVCSAQSNTRSAQTHDPDVAPAEKPVETVKATKAPVEKVADTQNLTDDPVAFKRFRFQLRKRIGKDQKTRVAILRYRKTNNVIDPEKIKKLYKKASDVDGDNLKWAKTHVQKFGWPAISTIGSRPADEFFTIVLHADRDSKFQRECLELMSNMPDGEWSPKNHKTLEDRVKLLKGKYEHMPLPTTPIPRK